MKPYEPMSDLDLARVIARRVVPADHPVEIREWFRAQEPDDGSKEWFVLLRIAGDDVATIRHASREIASKMMLLAVTQSLLVSIQNDAAVSSELS